MTASIKFLEEAALIPSTKSWKQQTIRKSSQLNFVQNKCAPGPLPQN